MFYKKSSLERFCNIHWKTTALESLSNKNAGLEIIKKRLHYKCFPVNDAKCLRVTNLKNMKLIPAFWYLTILEVWQFSIFEVLRSSFISLPSTCGVLVSKYYCRSVCPALTGLSSWSVVHSYQWLVLFSSLAYKNKRANNRNIITTKTFL